MRHDIHEITFILSRIIQLYYVYDGFYLQNETEKNKTINNFYFDFLRYMGKVIVKSNFMTNAHFYFQ